MSNFIDFLPKLISKFQTPPEAKKEDTNNELSFNQLPPPKPALVEPTTSLPQREFIPISTPGSDLSSTLSTDDQTAKLAALQKLIGSYRGDNV